MLLSIRAQTAERSHSLKIQGRVRLKPWGLPNLGFVLGRRGRQGGATFPAVLALPASLLSPLLLGPLYSALCCLTI